jgi:hypothetical protein
MSIVKQLVLSQLWPRLTPPSWRARPRDPRAGEASPRYVDRPGEIVLRPPFENMGVRLNAFAFPASERALQALVDRQLNDPLGGAVDYRVAAPMVVLAHADIDHIRSSHPGDGAKGAMAEDDVAFWVPLLATTPVGGVALPTRFAWYQPYIWVDNSIAAFGGREIYGFPKQTATIESHEDEHGLAHLGITTHVMSVLAPDSRPTLSRLVDLVRVGDGGGAPGGLRQHLDGFMESLQRGRVELTRRLTGSRLPAAEALGALLEQEVHMVVLKQFRVAGDGGRACYQAIVEATATVTGYRRAGFLRGEYRLDVHAAESHPVRADLGLGDGEIRAEAGFWIDYDFRLDEGREVARAG